MVDSFYKFLLNELFHKSIKDTKYIPLLISILDKFRNIFCLNPTLQLNQRKKSNSSYQMTTIQHIILKCGNILKTTLT